MFWRVYDKSEMTESTQKKHQTSVTIEKERLEDPEIISGANAPVPPTPGTQWLKQCPGGGQRGVLKARADELRDRRLLIESEVRGKAVPCG